MQTSAADNLTSARRLLGRRRILEIKRQNSASPIVPSLESVKEPEDLILLRGEVTSVPSAIAYCSV
jgi:hypothetical protein